ncbi:hypothetical protein BDZ97DRAFT_1861828 [Flammula alnicola]|nr:hypothetical protein BDZ97DRAFT_1861828 [Flammula alnicola]
MTWAGPLLNKRTSILSLPSEVLLRIFEEVYLASCHIDFDSAPPSKLADPALFPYCIMRVCKAWKTLVRSVPLFATRVIIFVDEPVVFKDLQDQFRDSKSLLIKVFVVRKEYPETNDPLEKDGVVDVMKALIPHITRCQVVVFDLLHSSSLPRIADFSGKAAKLRTLRIKSRIANSNEDAQIVAPVVRTLTPFLCPSLQYLDLDCHVFIEALRIPKWEESLNTVSKKHLSLSNIRGLDAEEFDLRDLILALSKMGHFTSLKLSQIDLDHKSCLKRGFPGRVFIQNFEFIGLSRELITGFFAAYDNRIDVSNLVMKRCQLGRVRYVPSWYLNLQEIDAEEDISGFVSHWDGFGLHILDCPGVDDRLLEMLAQFQPNDNNFFAPTLRQLQIRVPPRSSSISIEAVKHLIVARREEAAKHDPLTARESSLPMYSLSVTGSALQLPLQDRAWFYEHLECFLWDTPPTRCDSPVLTNDCSEWDFSGFDDSQITSLIPSQSEQCDSQRSSILDEVPRSQSPVISDDYCEVEWSADDVGIFTFLFLFR